MRPKPWAEIPLPGGINPLDGAFAGLHADGVVRRLRIDQGSGEIKTQEGEIIEVRVVGEQI